LSQENANKKAIKIYFYMLKKINDMVKNFSYEDIINAYYYPENNRGTIEKVLAQHI
jgi:hypothetical protein